MLFSLKVQEVWQFLYVSTIHALVGLEIQPLLVKLMYVKQKVSVCNTLLHELSCLTPLQTYS